jgi:DNA repair exonuclease SbcCD ATPase subunit
MSISVQDEIAANLRREKDEWNVTRGDLKTQAKMAHALFGYLVQEGDIVPMTDEYKKEKQELLKQLQDLENQLDQPNANEELINKEIERLEEEINTYDAFLDVYNIIPIESRYGHYGLDTFFVQGEDTTYAVGYQDDWNYAMKEYIENLLDDEGYNGFSSSWVESFIDEDEVVEYFRDMYNDMINDDPESWLSDSDRELSDTQKDQVNLAYEKISQINSEIEKLNVLLKIVKTSEQKKQTQSKIEELESLNGELVDKIEEIEEDPQGEFPEEKIEQAIENAIENVKSDPVGELRDMDMEIDKFVDRDKFIEDTALSEGYDAIAPYDGTVSEYPFDGRWYFIGRID